jgi:putative acetyltransferase
VILRAARAEDDAAIARVVDAAFGGPAESAIILGVRAEGRSVVDLVAENGGAIVGHVLFSHMTCEPAVFVVGLAPLAVAPDRQGQGIGQALSREGLRLCRELGAVGAVVLGDPNYYSRFGFSAEMARPLRSPYAGSPAFQAVELVHGGLAGVTSAAYPAAFG